MGRLALDPVTIKVLTEHCTRYEAIVRALGQEPTDQAFLFFAQPMRDRPYSPDAVSIAMPICAAIWRPEAH